MNLVLLGLSMGNLWVRNSVPIPVPTITIPVVGMVHTIPVWLWCGMKSMWCCKNPQYVQYLWVCPPPTSLQPDKSSLHMSIDMAVHFARYWQEEEEEEGGIDLPIHATSWKQPVHINWCGSAFKVLGWRRRGRTHLSLSCTPIVTVPTTCWCCWPSFVSACPYLSSFTIFCAHPPSFTFVCPCLFSFAYATCTVTVGNFIHILCLPVLFFTCMVV